MVDSRPIYLYVNPRGESRRWDRYNVVPDAMTEIELLKDIDGDGKPEVLFGGAGGVMSFAKPDPANPTARWIVTAISEVARNILLYAREGDIVLRLDNHDGHRGIVVEARDEGPGIPDLDLAMRDSYSTGNGLGLGLPGARRLMDEFEIQSELSKGTIVVMKQWAPERV